MWDIIVLFVLAFFAALVVTPALRQLSLRCGWVDAPDGERKRHGRPIPRTGGVALTVAYVFAMVVTLLLEPSGLGLLPVHLMKAVRLAPAVLLVVGIGLLDDIFGLTPGTKLTGEAAAAMLAFWMGGVQVTGVAGWVVPEWASLAVTVLWLLVVTNAMNLIDGLDGLATGMALFAVGTMMVVAVLTGQMTLLLFAAPLAGALLGFLRYNFYPASIFLGDSGSLGVGFLLGCFGIIWSQKSATVLALTAPLMALTVPLLDVGVSICRRYLAGKPIFGADRGHLHHQLLSKGLSVRRAVLVAYGVALVYAVLSLAGATVRADYGGAVLVVFAAVTWMGLHQMGYVEFGAAGRLLLRSRWRGLVSGQVAVEKFGKELGAASTEDEMWGVLRRWGREMGFAEVELRINGERRREEWGEKSWEITATLEGGATVVLGCQAGQARLEAVGPFVERLREGLDGRAGASQRGAGLAVSGD